MAGSRRKKERWMIHCCSPFDFGWEFTSPVPVKDERLFQLLAAAASERPEWYPWEKDFSYEPRYLVWVAGENALSHGYIWKQPNNGTTYVATMEPLSKSVKGDTSFVMNSIMVEIDAPENE